MALNLLSCASLSPITHFLISWLVADQVVETDRDRGLIALAGVAADADGAGALVDVANHVLGRPETSLYEAGHHWLLHGIFGCILISAVLTPLARARNRVFLASLLTTHLHLVCDLIGSRGPNPGDFWTIFYFGPFTRYGEASWSGQWRLDSWQNVTITLLALLLTFHTAWRWARSPLSLLSSKVNEAVVSALRLRFGQPQHSTH